MSQFRSYSIHVVYSVHSQNSADNTAAEFYNQGDMHMHHWMKTTGKALVQITPDSAPAHIHERMAYENGVKASLARICGTPIGLWVIESIDRGSKVWIHPNPNLFYTAVTHPAKTVKEGGGIRIHINLEGWGDTLDDTLLHELLHAARFSQDKYDPRPVDDEFPSSEEFLATQVSNIHRSFLGQPRFYARYVDEHPTASKGTLYSTFVERPMLIMAIKFCLDHEPLAVRLARLPQHRPDFNPFRDYPVLERMALGKIQVGPHGAGKFMPL